jgi:hypothetical protein
MKMPSGQVLEEFRIKYGAHPLLFEMEADFTGDTDERIALYREAVRCAVTGKLPTYTIRISLARVLLEDKKDPASALGELLACRTDLRVHADTGERREWHELHDLCRNPPTP